MKAKKILFVVSTGIIFILVSSFKDVPSSILTVNKITATHKICGVITVYASSSIMGYSGYATSSFTYPSEGLYNAPVTVIDANGFTIPLHNVSHSYDPYTKTYFDGWEGDAKDPSTGVEYQVSATIEGNYGNWSFDGTPEVNGII